MQPSLIFLFLVLFNGFTSTNTLSVEKSKSPNHLSNSLPSNQNLKANPWIVLFDGKSTDSWRGYNMNSFPSKSWKVENKELIITKSTNTTEGQTDLITKNQYENFIFEADFKCTAEGNSGILYHVVEVKGEDSWHNAPEYQILDDSYYLKHGQKDICLTGSNYDMDAPKYKVLKPLGEWNHAKVVVNHKHVEHWLNGKKVVDYVLESPEWKKKLAASKFNVYPKFGLAKTGYIALQNHGEEVHFKNIRIKVL